MRLVRVSLGRLCTLSLVVAYGMFASQLGAQQPEARIPAATIRVNTRLVLVDAVVTDKKGQPITDLKPEDFVIEENGKKQKIATFSTPTDAAKLAAPGELPPGIYSNQPEYRGAGGPMVVFVMDAANTPFRDQSYGRWQMLKFVQEQKKPDQRMAIYALTDRLHLIQDFTADPDVLTKALQRYRPQEPALGQAGPAPASAAASNVEGGPGGAVAAMVNSAAQEINSFTSLQLGFVLERRTETTLEGMRSLARTLGGMPGRKEVIWLTAAFPFDLIPQDRNVSEAEAQYLQNTVRQRSLGDIAGGSMAEHARSAHTDEILRVASALSTAQVAMYPVDVRGLMSGIELNFNNTLNPVTSAPLRMSDVTANQETMREIAAQTGGKAYVNQNEIREGILLALADNQAAYTIGYYPEDKKWNGKYRNIKLKVSRDGVQVRSRKGYIALDPTQDKTRKPDQELAEAIRDGIPATLVGFKAQVKPAVNGKVHIDFLVDAHTVTGADAGGGKKKLDVDIYSAILAPDGKILSSRSLKIAREFPADVFSQILQQGMLVPLEVDAAPGKDNQLRLAVRDNATGGIGSLSAPIT